MEEEIAPEGREEVRAEPGQEAAPQDTHSRPSSRPSSRPQAWSWPEPTVLTLQDLLDLPRQILPEETYRHLQNATRETALTFYSLWQHLSKSFAGGSGEKVRRHIEIE